MSSSSSLPHSRRAFIERSAAAAALGLSTVSSIAQTGDEFQNAESAKSPDRAREGEPEIRVLLHDADGSPIDHDRRSTLIARDLANETLPQAIASAEGRARITLANEPIQIACRLKVPGFGEVYCYADNNGKGFTKPGTIEFVVEAAQTRLRRVRETIERAHGVAMPSHLNEHLSAAARPIPKEDGKARIGAAYESLSHGLHAGEILALTMARHHITKLGAPRKEFLFGAAISHYWEGGNFVKHFLEAFNFATGTWYTWSQKTEPAEQRIDYTRMDQAMQWILDHKLVPRSFGYVYLTSGAMPEWLRNMRYDEILPIYKRVVSQTTKRYDGRLPYVEVINEAHDKANHNHLSHAQMLELTREACKSAREGSPSVKRMINHCCLWGENAKRKNDDGSRRWTPWRYIKDCISAGVEFEIIGLQMYYPQQDLFEINRMLDRFAVFKKPIFITEIGCNSVDGLIPNSMGKTRLVPGWHGPWTETMQADWLEGLYTLCYSKPEFGALQWWDFADYDGHFWPSGGLLHKDYTPKESFARLLQLQKQWGVAKTM